MQEKNHALSFSSDDVVKACLLPGMNFDQAPYHVFLFLGEKQGFESSNIIFNLAKVVNLKATPPFHRKREASNLMVAYEVIILREQWKSLSHARLQDRKCGELFFFGRIECVKSLAIYYHTTRDLANVSHDLLERYNHLPSENLAWKTTSPRRTRSHIQGTDVVLA
jgi:hypothetical protein